MAPYIIIKIITKMLNKHFYYYHDRKVFFTKTSMRGIELRMLLIYDFIKIWIKFTGGYS